MRYFIHTVTDTELIRDPDGEDFADQQMAEQEAAQVARDFIAEALRKGKHLPLRWKVLLASADDTILLSLPFSQLISDHEASLLRPGSAEGTGLDTVRFGADRPPAPWGSQDTRQLIDDVRDTIRRGRAQRAEVRASIAETYQNLQTLARLMKVLPPVGQTEMMETQD